jgi:hypothetical protein
MAVEAMVFQLVTTFCAFTFSVSDKVVTLNSAVRKHFISKSSFPSELRLALVAPSPLDLHGEVFGQKP